MTDCRPIACDQCKQIFLPTEEVLAGAFYYHSHTRFEEFVCSDCYTASEQSKPPPISVAAQPTPEVPDIAADLSHLKSEERTMQETYRQITIIANEAVATRDKVAHQLLELRRKIDEIEASIGHYEL